MRHLLMDPAFPDIVGELAARELDDRTSAACPCANDNGDHPSQPADALLTVLGRREIAATRLW
jgi:hypothetical protein